MSKLIAGLDVQLAQMDVQSLRRRRFIQAWYLGAGDVAQLVDVLHQIEKET